MQYRTGAVGALLNIYANCMENLKAAIADLPDEKLRLPVTTNTTDENCISIQSILTHVVYAAFGYANSIGNHFNQTSIVRREKIDRNTVQQYGNDLDEAFAYTVAVMENITDANLEQHETALKIQTAWGQYYDIEQLMEHAIVHILRHQYQIEKILSR